MKLKWLISTAAITLMIMVAFLGLAKHDAVMAAQDIASKIDAVLLDRFTTDGSSDFIVRFSDQADLSAAAGMDWTTRGVFVYDSLVETANQSQANAIAILNSNGYRNETLVGGNDLYVWGGTVDIANQLAALPEVYFIRATKTYYIDPVVVSKSLDNISWAGDFLAKNAMTTVGSTDAITAWGLIDTKADQFWTAFGVKGAGMKVANIDTGVQWNHPALDQSFACPGDPGNADCWADPSNICGGTACDNNGHGTHTMGTMVGDDDPSLTYIAGMAPEATWIACKGCETNSCSDYALTTCATWILAPGGDANNRPNVVNNSWGDVVSDPWYLTYVQNWRNAGIFPAFSAGNAGPSCATVGSPGDYQEALSSAAHDSGRNIASFSSRGPSSFGHEPYTKPNISAPGVNVCSTVPTNGWSCGYSGTSMASPHTAGAVALLWACNPSLIGAIDETFLALQGTANTPPAGNCGAPPDAEGNYTFGYGYLDVLEAGISYCGGVETGFIEGHVYDQNNDPLEGATVTAEGGVEGAGVNATTDPNGYYTMELVVGTYNVTASKVNYTSDTVMGVEVTANETTIQDFQISFLGAWTQIAMGTGCPDWTRMDMEYYAGTGLAYILGGRSGSTYLGTIYSYNPETNTCVNTGQTMPVPVANYTILQVNDGTDDLLCTFGGGISSTQYSDAVQCYNPVANTVAQVSTLPGQLGQFIPGGAAVVDNIAYVFSGFRNSAVPYHHTETWSWDPVTDSWTQEGNLSLGRAYLDVAVVDGLIYGFGGDVFDGANLNAQTKTEVFDPVAGTWDDLAVAELPTASGEGRAFGFDTASSYELAGTIVIAGGGQWPGDWNEVVLYNINTDSYDYDFPALNVQRRNQAGFFIPGDPGAMWVIGGRSGAAGYGGDNPPYAPPEYFEVAVAEEPAPDIAVDPLALDVTLPADATKTVALTISNVGNLPLDWSLAEVPGLLNVKVTPDSSAVPSSPRQVALTLGSKPGGGESTNAPQVPDAAVQLELDDNSAENFIGLNDGVYGYQFIWLNRFTPSVAEFPFTLNEISVIMGVTGVAVGDPIDLVVYEDTDGDGDPSNATWLATYNVTVQYNDGTTWNNYTLSSPLALSGPGDVLIGVINRYQVSGVELTDFPAALDQTASQLRSWVGAWNLDPPDPATLPPDGLWGLIDDYFPGNWMIRGYGETMADVPWLSETPTSGTIPAGGSVEVLVTFDSSGLALGDYSAFLNISSNDPDEATVVVPVTMTVGTFNFYLPLALRQ